MHVGIRLQHFVLRFFRGLCRFGFGRLFLLLLACRRRRCLAFGAGRGVFAGSAASPPPPPSTLITCGALMATGAEPLSPERPIRTPTPIARTRVAIPRSARRWPTSAGLVRVGGVGRRRGIARAVHGVHEDHRVHEGKAGIAAAVAAVQAVALVGCHRAPQVGHWSPLAAAIEPWTAGAGDAGGRTASGRRVRCTAAESARVARRGAGSPQADPLALVGAGSHAPSSGEPPPQLFKSCEDRLAWRGADSRSSHLGNGSGRYSPCRRGLRQTTTLAAPRAPSCSELRRALFGRPALLPGVRGAARTAAARGRRAAGLADCAATAARRSPGARTARRSRRRARLHADASGRRHRGDGDARA